MGFSQEERITLSKSIIDIPGQIAEIDKTLATLSISQQDLYNKDMFVKNICDKKTLLIDFYQNELKYINGYNYVSITENDIQNSGKKQPLNIFFPADQSFPTPSVPTGVWKYFVPFMLSGAIGKNRSEAYTMLTNYEKQDINYLISTIDSFVTTYTAIIRTTGQACVVGVPPDVDVISSDPVVTGIMSSLISKVNLLKTTLQSEKAAAIANTDSDSTRVLEKNNNISSIDTMILAIDTWLAYPDFNTAHGQTDCSGFASYNAALLAPTKGYNTQIQALKTALQSRLTDALIRETQINGYLGVVVQDVNTGELTTTTGFYGDRAKVFDLRLNLIGGSLSAYLSSFTASGAVNQQKNALLNKLDVYSSLLKTSKLKAPSNGTSFIHVSDATGFSIGQTVYLMANSQKEITLTIIQKTGTMIQVDKNIPPTYRPTDGARMYVDLS